MCKANRSNLTLYMRIQENPQGSILAKLRWLDKHDMTAAAECQCLLLGGHDYVAWKLSGALVTDATTASTTGLTDLSFERLGVLVTCFRYRETAAKLMTFICVFTFMQYAESLIKKVHLGHWLEMLPRIAPVNVPCGRIQIF
eukprot:Gb_31349 [translate_table: standard]